MVIVLLVVGYFAWRSNSEPAVSGQLAGEKNIAKNIETPPAEEKQAPKNTDEASSPPADSLEAQIKRTAIDFVSRFGTFSTDAPNANIIQLRPAMGPKLGSWADARIQKPPVAYVKFESVTTKALAAQIISKTAERAELKVSTQRIFSNKTPAVQYQTADVSLVLSKGVWLVDAVTWNE